jgi:hypothetical protein
VRRSLTTKATTTMIRAFMCTGVDYGTGSAVYAGLTLLRINQIQSVHSATARLIGGIRKFGRTGLSFTREELH